MCVLVEGGGGLWYLRLFLLYASLLWNGVSVLSRNSRCLASRPLLLPCSNLLTTNASESSSLSFSDTEQASQSAEFTISLSSSSLSNPQNSGSELATTSDNCLLGAKVGLMSLRLPSVDQRSVARTHLLLWRCSVWLCGIDETKMTSGEKWTLRFPRFCFFVSWLVSNREHVVLSSSFFVVFSSSPWVIVLYIGVMTIIFALREILWYWEMI